MERGDIIWFGTARVWGVVDGKSPSNKKLSVDILYEPDHWVSCWCDKYACRRVVNQEVPDVVFAKSVEKMLS